MPGCSWNNCNSGVLLLLLRTAVQACIVCNQQKCCCQPIWEIGTLLLLPTSNLAARIVVSRALIIPQALLCGGIRKTCVAMSCGWLTRNFIILAAVYHMQDALHHAVSKYTMVHPLQPCSGKVCCHAGSLTQRVVTSHSDMQQEPGTLGVEPHGRSLNCLQLYKHCCI
ncbi:hypothetical protein COO60DRAFT_1700304 [Scenedesmus sp. NREL 46B-D3]|nr:hypothetical protein COO60DRAFT_1700304 [Scenedesmus sp. NREL 46B-D3]